MAKKVANIVKLQIPAGAATPAPSVGPALGQKQVLTLWASLRNSTHGLQTKGYVDPSCNYCI